MRNIIITFSINCTVSKNDAWLGSIRLCIEKATNVCHKGRMKKRHNHTIYCSEDFKKKVESVCLATDMSSADLVKAVFLFSDKQAFESIRLEKTDNMREKVVVKSGANVGKVILRKPRIQIILPFKISPDVLKKALTLAIKPQLKKDECVDFIDFQNATSGSTKTGEAKPDNKTDAIDSIIITDGVQPDMVENITTIRDAFHILGFAPRASVKKTVVKDRYKKLLKAYHTDTGTIFADSDRLNAIQTAWKIIDKSL